MRSFFWQPSRSTKCPKTEEERDKEKMMLAVASSLPLLAGSATVLGLFSSSASHFSVVISWEKEKSKKKKVPKKKQQKTTLEICSKDTCTSLSKSLSSIRGTLMVSFDFFFIMSLSFFLFFLLSFFPFLSFFPSSPPKTLSKFSESPTPQLLGGRRMVRKDNCRTQWAGKIATKQVSAVTSSRTDIEWRNWSPFDIHTHSLNSNLSKDLARCVLLFQAFPGEIFFKLASTYSVC